MIGHSRRRDQCGLLGLSGGGGGHSLELSRAEQCRLPKELALAGITTIAAAVAPAETGSAFVAERSGRVRILCTQEERLVGNDNTVKWRVSSC
jgi:hypothetical protein